jgi:hypothetical protein
MTKRITAIRRYKPDIKRGPTQQMAQVVEDISQRTGLREGEILHVVYELQDSISLAHRHGQAVKIEGFGIFTPVMRINGSFDILFRPDVKMLKKLNELKFYAEILNKSNIGKSSDELIAQWNAENPDDPVEE